MTSAQPITLVTRDGHSLAADVASPFGPVCGGIVLCHPHPGFGGNRFNHVVDALFRSFPAAGFRTLRFDFRDAHDGGRAERLDVVAAVDAVSAELGELPLAVAGYSFGAAVALATEDDRIGRIVAIAPPLTMMPVAAPAVPVLVLTPEHDQFCPPDDARATAEEWPTAEFEVIGSTDHSITGRTGWVADRAVTWLTSGAPPAMGPTLDSSG